MVLLTYLLNKQDSKAANEDTERYSSILGGGRGWSTTDRAFSGVRGPNLTKLGKNVGLSWLYTHEICFRVRISRCIFKRGRLKVD